LVVNNNSFTQTIMNFLSMNHPRSFQVFQRLCGAFKNLGTIIYLAGNEECLIKFTRWLKRPARI
jgi:hypothetical protein